MGCNNQQKLLSAKLFFTIYKYKNIMLKCRDVFNFIMFQN